MASLGKKILSAFIEVEDKTKKEEDAVTQPVQASSPPRNTEARTAADTDNKFSDYFNRLFADANLPGPDYYEFAKMIEAMHVIKDESARFSAAFAGLQAQGLDKQKLLSSAQEYVKILDADAAAFHSTVDQALLDKVQNKKKEMDQVQEHIQKLSQEILSLQQQIGALTQEIAENEAKIENNSSGYDAAMTNSRNKLLQDIEKIKQHIL
ncbi:DUF3450 domain-containing protein [Chitinophaga sp. CF418]|uniref:DUF3450 domain-containing protein n=1 Tax=Chitinophaga sp. CF418 TaxID=1855287 RepID=UPI000910B4CC|nr:DUF3450 domain-containing protein [Chitinophaga sp. CF418]SHN33049.1 hypothetical protein SAMN05216311_109137 [Chitinophaga sp. CF418]